jgi:hypothetical protein
VRSQETEVRVQKSEKFPLPLGVCPEYIEGIRVRVMRGDNHEQPQI